MSAQMRMLIFYCLGWIIHAKVPHSLRESVGLPFDQLGFGGGCVPRKPFGHAGLLLPPAREDDLHPLPLLKIIPFGLALGGNILDYIFFDIGLYEVIDDDLGDIFFRELTESLDEGYPDLMELLGVVSPIESML